MIAVSQGCIGIALVLCFAMLRTRPVNAVTLLLLAQSAAIAAAAAVLHHPVAAIVPAVLGGVAWQVRPRTAAIGIQAPPISNVKAAILAGAVLTALCQSQGPLAQPLTLLLMGILIAATRPHRIMQVPALCVAANGVTLLACQMDADTGPMALLPLAALLLPVLAALPLLAGHFRPAWRNLPQHMVRHGGRLRLGLSGAMFAATLVVPLDPAGALFAPLLALDGLLRAWTERGRNTRRLLPHAVGLCRSAALIIAVAAPNDLVAWTALIGVMVLSLSRVQERCWQRASMAFCTAALALFGLAALDMGADPIGYPLLLIGLAGMALMMPETAVAVLVLVLRKAGTESWSESGAPAALIIALTGLLAGAVSMWRNASTPRLPRLLLLNLGVALLALGLASPQGRYAAIIMLVLLVLTQGTARMARGPLACVAACGLAGIAPAGTFPALVLVGLAVATQAPWLLLPLGIAAMASLRFSLRPPPVPWQLRPVLLSGAWVPLALAVIIGFLTPETLSQWLRVLAGAGP